MKKILSRTLLIVVFLALLVTFIAYSRGYRFSLSDRGIVPTGIISVSSSPRPAKIYVNGTFRGATDTNLTLPPGEYTVEVKREGYTSYKRTLRLKGEIVETVDAILFPVNPSLTPLTNLGIVKAVPVDSTDRLILFIENADAPEKDGVYLFEVGRGPISIFPPLKPLVLKSSFPAGVDFSQVAVHFSPTYDQAILDLSTGASTFSYLIALDEQNQDPFDITTSRATLIDAWLSEHQKAFGKILETYPKAFARVAAASTRIVAFSPTETKVLYQATEDAELPLIINPPLIASNQTPQDRTLKKSQLYVYDRKEDKNFPIAFDAVGMEKYIDPVMQGALTQLIDRNLAATAEQAGNSVASAGARARSAYQGLQYVIFSGASPIQWYPNSRGFVIDEEAGTGAAPATPRHQFTTIDYDGTNRQAIYSGPYEMGFYMVTAGGKVVILVNLNPQANRLPDLYLVGIR